MVTLATAHPAKFAAAVARATGAPPPLPAGHADLATRPEQYAVLANDRVAVEEFIMVRARAAAEKV
jgi:threonine synthase